jgi:hypothetical protein
MVASDVLEWPADVLQRWIDAAVLCPTEPAMALPCLACGGDHTEEIVYLSDPAGHEPRAYLPCPICGPSRIALAELRQWRIEFACLLKAVFAEGIEKPDLRTIVPDRLWQVGRTRLGDRGVAVWAGRRLNARDAAEVLRRVRLPRNAVVFVPHAIPRMGLQEVFSGPIVPLTSVAMSCHGSIHLDWSHVEGQFADLEEGRAARKRTPPKRATRAADIAALTAELREHILAARDHARATRDQTGEAHLLPRPNQRDLAKRVGITPSSASRCFADESARELRILWDAAVDLERILDSPR